MLVQIAVYKCYQKFTPGGAETGTPAGEREGGQDPEYEQMDIIEGGGRHTYRNEGAVDGVNTFELQQMKHTPLVLIMKLD